MKKRTDLVKVIEDLAEAAFRSHGEEGRAVVAAINAVHRAWLAAQADN